MSLSVYLHDTYVGTLSDISGDRMRFQYDSAWLAHPEASPLSRSLPLQEQRFDGEKTKPFFAGLLPEESPRQKIANILGISESNDFAMLERIGGECAGAVSLFPQSQRPQLEQPPSIRWMNKQELATIVEELPRRPLLADEDGLRLSLAGAQNKLPVVFEKNRIGLPLGRQASTHILKPEAKDYPGLAANEFFCMRLAKSTGLPVPDVEFLELGDSHALLIRRYDRHQNEEGNIVRIHQEDFCQALGCPPSRKYQQENGPNLPQCFELLREWSTIPVLDIRHFLDGLIFNIAIGNADAHGKNYSFLYDDQQRRVAPFYDLVCTLAWPELSTRTAMSIGPGKMMNEINSDHWKEMTSRCQLGWPMVRERIADMREKILENLDTIADERTDPALVSLIRTRCEN